MSNNTTGVKPDDCPEVPIIDTDEYTIANRLQRRGYVRVYRAVWEDCGLESALLYGTLEDYAQLSIRNQRPCVPTQAELAAKMGTTDRHLRRYLTSLKEKGWIATKQIAKNRTSYTLTQPGQKCPVSPDKNVQSHRTKMSGLYSKQDIANQSKQEEKQASLPKEVGTQLEQEQANPYWHDENVGKRRLEAFEWIYQHFPKQGSLLQAMQAWRETMGTRLDDHDDEASTALWKAVQDGVDWYARACHQEKKPRQHILSFPYWVREELWTESPVNNRARKVA